MKIKKNILITGGLGFIGQNLVKFFLKKNWNVHIIDNLSSINSVKKYLFDLNRVKIFYLDIGDSSKISSFFNKKDYDFIIHAAANFANQNSIDHPRKDMKTNILGTINILECIKNKNLKKIIYLSSSCVYPSENNLTEQSKLRPVETPYAISKFTSELYAEFYSSFYKLPINIVRIFNTYGPGEKAHKYRNVIPNFINSALKNKTITITGSGKEVRDFTYVEDVAEIIFKSLKLKKKRLQIINSCTGKGTKLINLAKKIKYLTGSKSKIKLTNKLRKWDQIKVRRGSVKQRENLFGQTKLTSLNQGLESTIKWYKKNY